MLLLMMEDLLSSRSIAISSRALSRWLETRADIFLSNRFMVALLISSLIFICFRSS